PDRAGRASAPQPSAPPLRPTPYCKLLAISTLLQLRGVLGTAPWVAFATTSGIRGGGTNGHPAITMCGDDRAGLGRVGSRSSRMPHSSLGVFRSPAGDPQLPPVSTEFPTPARMYDYCLGGKDNFKVDRDAVLAAMRHFPQGVD